MNVDEKGSPENDDTTINETNSYSPNVFNEEESERGFHQERNVEVENQNEVNSENVEVATLKGQHDVVKNVDNSKNDEHYIQFSQKSKKQTKMDDYVKTSDIPKVTNTPNQFSKPPLVGVYCRGPKNLEPIEFIVNNSDQYLKNVRSRFLEENLLNLYDFMKSNKIATQSYQSRFSDETWKILEEKALGMKEYEMDI